MIWQLAFWLTLFYDQNEQLSAAPTFTALVSRETWFRSSEKCYVMKKCSRNDRSLNANTSPIPDHSQMIKRLSTVIAFLLMFCVAGCSDCLLYTSPSPRD